MGFFSGASGEKVTVVHFDSAVSLAKKHKLPVQEVRKRQEEFQEFNLDEAGELGLEEFKEVVRRYCGIDAGGEIPNHLLNTQWAAIDTDQSGAVSFEEFLVWSVGTEWSEERLVLDSTERYLRQVARDLGISIADVERIKTVFDKFDEDK